MTRPRPELRATAVLGLLAVLLFGCSADPDSPGSPQSGEGGGSTASGRSESDEVLDKDERTLPGGVKVLSQDSDEMVAVEAGRYAIRVSDSLLYQVDIPDDSGVAYGTYVNPGLHAGRLPIVWVEPTGESTDLPVHPCWDHTAKAVGSTAQALGRALSDLPFLQVMDPVDVTVGGMPGLFVKVTVPRDADMSKCETGTVAIVGEHGAVDEAGFVDRMWILDVEGVRQVLHAFFPATATGQDTRMVNRMVDSITFSRG